ncbi:MAG TPA: sugar transferase [Planosporangium sp.]|nr:sugar transferase [Planosporangium sp.]
MSAGLTSAVWYWLYANRWAPSYAALPAAAGAVVGAMVTTAVDVGFVENIAPPSSDARNKVRSGHSVFLRYRCRSFLKWTLDVAGALVGLALTLPLWPVIALLIWLEEPGPVFCAENVVGKRGVTFRRFWFRTTKYGTAPRILRAGRLLRRWHLDELPGLMNVLIGDMSLVGPRPLRTVLVRTHLEEVPEYAERHTVKPGMVCIAQLENYDMAPAERLEKDRAYIRRMSFLLDITLLARAVPATVRGQRRPAGAASPRSTSVRGVPTKVPTGDRGQANGPLTVRRGARPVQFERRSRPGGRRSTSTVYRSATFSHALPTDRRE